MDTEQKNKLTQLVGPAIKRMDLLDSPEVVYRRLYELLKSAALVAGLGLLPEHVIAKMIAYLFAED